MNIEWSAKEELRGSSSDQSMANCLFHGVGLGLDPEREGQQQSLEDSGTVNTV